ncbi:hypothetical protein GCM10007908_03830 [Rhizobium albus]|nr:hypothetical protein GCM10007908_03830 [Rhizobium albus]
MPTPLGSAPSVNRLGSAAFRNASSFVDGRLVISPYQFGGKGDGLQDDTGAIRAAVARFREIMLASTAQTAPVALVFSGGRWRHTDTIDITKIVGWNWQIEGGKFLGECTGKPMFDLCGSRGYQMQGVGFVGDRDNRPRCAWQAARLDESQFCDNVAFADCSSVGYFSDTVFHAYGQETANHHHCSWYNYDHEARVGIIEGFSANPFTSEFGTVIEGATSNINIALTGVTDLRYLPAGDQFKITGVTNAANAVFTLPGHEFQAGDQCVFAYVEGMPDLSTSIANILSVTATTITTDINTTTLGTYGGGGVAIRRQTKSPLYIARAEGVNIDDIYTVAYGKPQIELGFPDVTAPRMDMISGRNVLFEGSGNQHNVFVDNDLVPVADLLGFEMTTYNANATESLLGCGNNAVSVYAPDIRAFDMKWDAPLVDGPVAGANQWAMYGAKIVYPTLALTRYDVMEDFNGDITQVSDGESFTINKTSL